MSFDWKGLVSSVAPILGTALGGGPFVGMAVKAIAGGLGLESGATEADVSKALQSASPETLLALKEADQSFEVSMAELGVDLEKIAADDRNSARNREKETGDKTPKYLAAVIVIGFFGTLATIAFATIPPLAMPAVNILLGSLTALLIQVGNYYYGSSAGSKEKTRQMANK